MLKDKSLNRLEQKDFKSICRLCLNEGPSLRPIHGTKIPSMIQYCSDIKVLKEDELPTHVCVRCFRLITNFYTFKRKIIRNDHTLKNIIRRRAANNDIINIALEKSDIGPTELDELQKIEVIKNIVSKRIVNIPRHEGEARDKESPKSYHNSIYRNRNVGLIKQIQQKSFCVNYNIEPPPLVPLYKTSEFTSNNKDVLKNFKTNSLVSNKVFNSNIVLPPLIPINHVVEEDIAKIKAKAVLTDSTSDHGIDHQDILQPQKAHQSKTGETHTYECNICKKRFLDQKKLIGHLKQHKITKEYLCNVCGKRYSSPSTFRIHFRNHTGERPFKCNICGKGFVRWAGVKNHMVIHEDFKPYKCETCGKEFKVVSNLYRHQRLHTGIYKFNCSFCGKTFCQSDHLKLHIRTYHTNEKPYLCCECGKGFVSFQRLKRHEFVHSGQKPYPCSLCLRAYSNAIDLKNHILKVHNKNGNRDELKKYACSLCGLKFRHPCRLTKHMKTHENLNKDCQGCGLRFKSAQALTRHLETSSCKDAVVNVQSSL